MRIVVSALMLCAAAVVGYWLIFAHLMRERVADTLLSDAALEGSAGPVSGFPAQFRMTVEDLQWPAPDLAFALRAPWADLVIPAFPPTSLRAELSREMMLEIAGMPSHLTHSGLHANLEVASGGIARDVSFSLVEGRVEPALIVEEVAAIDGRVERREGKEYSVSLNADEVMMAQDFRAYLDPQGVLGDTITRLSLVADLAFVSSHTPDSARVVQIVDLESLSLDWAGLAASLGGSLQRNERDLFDGQLRLEAAGWQGIFSAFVDEGALDPNLGRLLGMVLTSQTDAATGKLTLRLDVRDSAVRIGPVVLATLPRF